MLYIRGMLGSIYITHSNRPQNLDARLVSSLTNQQALYKNLPRCACGPAGTGCACPKNKCNCDNCVNKQHSSQCECKGTGDSCACINQQQACDCKTK
ncbi:uncharacterized protein EDB91DRAFT_474145 [Suillus paluster]|uniref:uncharacterized protein n=1 Tax=Suillus paluster TaxID=48578 RepID=UPI001B8822D5|nr:uncharacterized protein EDB91DRAFT_474145 [Suillus paluster]KAG1737901.1 hypothetical protein EDB91DRAFT_474145 [Suillus paluster]